MAAILIILYSAVGKFATALRSVAALQAASLDFVSGAAGARSRCASVEIDSKQPERSGDSQPQVE